MELRNMFKKIFNKNPTSASAGPYGFNRLVSLNEDVNLYAAGDKTAYQNLFVRICIDALAENAAKLKPKAIRKQEGKIVPGQKKLQEILDLEPNPYMNSFDFLYKVVTCWALDNNAFIYIHRNPITNEVDGLYPITYANSEFMEYQGDVFVRFTFMNGFSMTVAYADLCHLRRFYGPDDLFGEDNEYTLKVQTGLLNTVNKGFAAAVNSCNKLKGILKMNLNLQNDDLKEAQEQFTKDYMNLTNSGGVAAIDTRMDYIELKNNIVTADDGQMKIIRNDIMSYFHVSEPILLASYTEDQWNAFYESVLEPIGLRLSMELTRKVFTTGELAHGNQIVFEANRLQYASTKSKIEMLKELIPMSILSVNEGREILNLAPVPEGDKRLLSLNYIDADLAAEYQLGKKKPAEEGGETGE